MWPNDNRNIILFPFLFNINNGNPRIDIINYLMELCSTVEEEYPEVLPGEDKQERRSWGSQSLYFVSRKRFH